MVMAKLCELVSDHLLDFLVAFAPVASPVFNGPVIGCLRAGFPEDFQTLLDNGEYRRRLESNFDYLALLGSLTLGWLNFTFNLLQSKNVSFDASVDCWIRGVVFVLVSLVWLLAFAPIVALFTIGPERFLLKIDKQFYWKVVPISVVVLQVVVLGTLEAFASWFCVADGA